ncbi:hypothetical protein Har1130_16320 [Haloarcula sp. CBA1130]|nr:hypothetical protein Har1129_19925 [Haloarcula sp. CBA1129]KAA9400320.1 hypothetical protein Har1130_16320 [Haloarcula sp. CBA1130]
MSTALPVQPTPAHLTAVRQHVRSLLADTDVSRVPNEVVRHRLAREREAARGALSQAADREIDRTDSVVSLTHPRSEAMFVHAGLAAFDGDLTESDVAARRDRHYRNAKTFLAESRYAGPPTDPVGTLVEHARIEDWGQTGVRIIKRDSVHEFENATLHIAELAKDVEWGRAYATDARRLSEHYVSTLEETHDYEDRFSRVATTLLADVEPYVDAPDKDALTSEIDRDIENTAAEELVQELARIRWSGAENAVKHHDSGRVALTVGSTMRALTADHALAATTDAIADSAYGVPESVARIDTERTAAIEGLRGLLNESPTLLARRLATYVRSTIQSADSQIRQGSVSSPGHHLYAQYAIANRFAAAAPSVIRRVGDALRE